MPNIEPVRLVIIQKYLIEYLHSLPIGSTEIKPVREMIDDLDDILLTL